MKAKELTAKKGTELQELLKEKREALRTFRFGVAGSKTRNVKEGKNLRKDIARILTVLKRHDKTT
jgi:ribosomal protein L29